MSRSKKCVRHRNPQKLAGALERLPRAEIHRNVPLFAFGAGRDPHEHFCDALGGRLLLARFLDSIVEYYDRSVEESVGRQ
jgi:hypothetical protein